MKFAWQQALSAWLLLFVQEITAREYTQTWTTTDQSIPVREIHKDCSNSELKSVSITDGLPSNQSCDKRNASLYMSYLSDQIKRCYTNRDCMQITWNIAGMNYKRCEVCTGSQCVNSLEEIQQLVQLQIEVTCDVKERGDAKITESPITDGLEQITVQRPDCGTNGQPTLEHLFGINNCAKPLSIVRQQQSTLERIKQEINSCQSHCQGINRLTAATLSGGGLCLDSSGPQSHRKLVAFWTCGTVSQTPSPTEPARTAAPASPTEPARTAAPQPVKTTKTPGEATQQHTDRVTSTNKQIKIQLKSTTPVQSESQKLEHGNHTGSLTDTTAKSKESDEKDYFIPFVAVTVVLVCVTVLFIVVLLCFLRKQRQKDKEANKRNSKPPPSRSSLYSNSQQTTKENRYDNEIDQNNYELPSDEIQKQKGTYHLANETTAQETQKLTEDENFYEVVGLVHTQPNEKKNIYSEGYLIPTSMRNSNA